MLSHCPGYDWVFGFDTFASSSRIDAVGFPRGYGSVTAVLYLTCVMCFLILRFCGAGFVRMGLCTVDGCNEKHSIGWRIVDRQPFLKGFVFLCVLCGQDDD